MLLSSWLRTKQHWQDDFLAKFQDTKTRKNCMIAKSKRVRDCFLIWSQEVAAAPYQALPTISRSGNRIVNPQKVQAPMNFAWFMTFQQYCNRTGTPTVFSCIIQYSENITAARFSLRFLPPPGTGTRRGPEQFTMWCSFLGCTSLILSWRQHHSTMVTAVNGRHVAPPGEKLASLFSSLVNEAFRNQTKCWKKYGVLSKATSWGDITWRCLCMFLAFSKKCVKAAAVPKGLWCKLASAHGLPAMMAFIRCGNKPCCQSMWSNVQGFIGNHLLQSDFSIT